MKIHLEALKMFGENVFTWDKTCEECKKHGIFPVESPSAKQKKQIRDILFDCLEYYVPLENDVPLNGIFLFNPKKQDERLRTSDGYAFSIDGKRAFIGLSTALLDMQNMEIYIRIVFLHELCHLHAWEHNEEFENRTGKVFFDYFYYNSLSD